MLCDFPTDLGALGILKSPILISSGTFGTPNPYLELLNDQPIGAVVTKTITHSPKPGNPQPRLREGSLWLINSIGLENPGIDSFVHQYAQIYGEVSFPVIVSISGHSVDEFSAMVKKLNALDGPIAIELNLSCPNVDNEGLAFGMHKDRMGKVVEQSVQLSRFPIIAKLSPFQAVDTSFAEAACRAGASAISLINTIPAMSFDIHRFRSSLGTLSGGMSGPAIKPIALKMVYEISRFVDIPVIGMGGIACADDAIEFLMAGAKAISIGTMNLVNPELPMSIGSGIASFLKRHKLKGISDISKQLKTE